MISTMIINMVGVYGFGGGRLSTNVQFLNHDRRITTYPNNLDSNTWIKARSTIIIKNAMDDEYEDMDEGTSQENDNNDNNSDEMNFFEQVDTIPDLSWRVEKLRLEEANTRRFLKAKPRYLPYEECRKWVAAWNRWESEKEWKEWINEGEKRNSYIPARPDEYYGRLGKWKGWDHFLGNVDDENFEIEDGNANDFQ